MKLGLSLYAMVCLAAPVALAGQAQHDMEMGTPNHAAHDAMAGRMASSAHMRMTPTRPRTVADSIRAMAVADTLRRALGRYADPGAAERDGFALFMPQVRNQKVFHYTKWSNALGEAFRFDASKPTSILYRNDSLGRKQLVGAMYTMPKRATAADLDQRVPLSVAHWHLHTNLCVPKKGDERRYGELQNGKPLFGLAGTISTKAACDAENGKFHDTIFGWMVHANVFEGTDLTSVWAHEEMMEHGQHSAQDSSRTGR